MLPKKKEHPVEKIRLHPRNRHRERYDFKELIAACPDLAPFVKLNVYNDESIDFFNPDAVKMLNKALLKLYYDIDIWDIPQNYLCPPIPGRADYIHYIADLLCSKNYGKIPTGPHIKCLDVGVGANCVYPIIGHKEYGWTFIGSDVDTIAIDAANNIINQNAALKGSVELRLQTNPKDIFYRIVQTNELIDVSICNPPFHASPEEAQSVTKRKLKNLKAEKTAQPILNFGGQNNELWCEGGEVKFVGDMIRQSKHYGTNIFWFSTSISKQSHLDGIYETLRKAEAHEVKTIPMGQGNKTSRIVAWTFLTKEQQKEWVKKRWQNVL